MGKVIQIEVPDWVNEEKLKVEILQMLSKEGVDIEDIRKLLNIRLEDLTEELETLDVEELRKKEKERIKW